MQPNYGTVQLGTPAVTNRGGPAGLTYLEDFVQLCVGCAYNFVNVHFFVDRDQMNVAQYIHALKVYIEADVPAIQARHKPLTGLPIAIGEVSTLPLNVPSRSHHRLTPSQFWLTGASEDEAGTLMDELLPWLDNNANVLFYQAAGGLFAGAFVNAAGTGLTPAGTAYGTLAP